MNGRTNFWLAAIPLFLLTHSALTAAQDLASAEALFNKGLADMEAGKFDTGCPAIAESQRLDPRPGTQFTLADCHNKAGKIATAAALYEDYLRAVAQMPAALKFRHATRAKVATAQKAALAPRIPQLTLTLAAAAPRDLNITRDGTELTAATLGIALPLDPGEHVITTQVGAGPVTEQRVTLEKGDNKTIELELALPKPETATAPAGSSAAAHPPAGQATAGLAAGGPNAAAMSGRRMGAFIAGGVGVAGLALGAAMGGLVLAQKGAIEQGCVKGVCTPEGKAAADSVQVPGLVSTIGFAAGAAGLATGLVLFLTEPPAGKETKVGRWTVTVLGASPEGAAVGVKGAF